MSDIDIVLRVRVVNGQELAFLDTTGTITTKYQARLEIRVDMHELVSAKDTAPMLPHVRSGICFDSSASSIDEPEAGALLPIGEIFNRLLPISLFSFRVA